MALAAILLGALLASTVLAFGSFTGLAWWFDVGKGMP
jgi:hypothetical protein